MHVCARMRGSRRKTQFGATLSISTPRNLQQQNLPDAAHRWTLCGQRGRSPYPFPPSSYPEAAGIDYEIALDKANEIPPRARLVGGFLLCSCERVSLMSGLLVTFPIVSTYRCSVPLARRWERSTSPFCLSMGMRTPRVFELRRVSSHVTMSRLFVPPTPEDGAHPLIAIRLYLALCSKLQYALSCASCHAAASL